MLVTFFDGTSREVSDLRGAILSGAILSGANLRGADLGGADLIDADLIDADLRDANLRGSNLSGANLHGADLRDANLRGSNLSDANLGGANLRGADLRGAGLRGAGLIDADLGGAEGLAAFQVVPELGAFTCFKKLSTGTVAVLHIPAEAKRVNAYGSRKCRVEFAYVLEGDGGTGTHSPGLIYKKGSRVECDKFDPDPRVECSGGIHVFMTRQEAEEWH